jgi:hypothetical protein
MYVFYIIKPSVVENETKIADYSGTIEYHIKGYDENNELLFYNIYSSYLGQPAFYYTPEQIEYIVATEIHAYAKIGNIESPVVIKTEFIQGVT